MKILDKIKNIWKTGDYLHIETPKDKRITFKLSFEDLLIGYLTTKDGNWQFSYSEEFKNQDKIKPLANFPNKFKIYESSELYPFFEIRIPSLKQPKIQAIIEKENIEKSRTELLKRFGKRSISNPFVLTAEF